MRSVLRALLIASCVSLAWNTPAAAAGLVLTSPVSPEILQLTKVEGSEGISTLYRFELEAIAPRGQSVPFGALLGQPLTVTVTLGDGSVRHFSGICARISEHMVDRQFVYRLEMVPRLWRLTQNAGSQIFQDQTIPDVLQQILTNAGIASDLQLANVYTPRQFVVQYRESDFNFISRLMEEEGIFYFFRHSTDGHTMVIADTPQSHPDLGSTAVPFLSNPKPSERGIGAWEKIQELRPGKYTLSDYTFHAPSLDLEVNDLIQEIVQAGQITHSLRIANSDLEIYDYPGGYAKRFDGAGGVRAEGQKAVRIRMQQEAAQALSIEGSASQVAFASGHKFALSGHPNADGPYVLTSVQHSASAGPTKVEYSNSFTCIPMALPFRPVRVTPRPVPGGPETAFVVGPPGVEIFKDSLGRVKVQFHWDRQGQNDENSSVWIRVAALFAGRERGGLFFPEVGDEVLVAFEHGDVDRPVIIGSLYNDTDRPPAE